MKNNWQFILTIFLLFAMLGTSFFSQTLLHKMRKSEQLQEQWNEAKKKSVYGVDGKLNGAQLAIEPIQVTKEHVFFEDRVLERFIYDENSILQGTEILNAAFASLPENINKYLMLVPIRISIEKAIDDKGDEQGIYELYSDNVFEAIGEIYAQMPPDVQTLDAVGALLAHREEYLYFRTDHIWTALGAYYAAKVFGEQAGIEMISIEKYRENRFEDYLGTMRKLPGAESLSHYPDYVSYYILDGTSNQQTINYRRGNEVVTYQAPTVALSRRGTDIFVGSYFSHSVLQGDAANGKTLMILGDKYSKAFAPWLTPYYEQVLLINLSSFHGGAKEFWSFFYKHKITDLLIIEYAKKMGDSDINLKLKELMQREKSQQQ